MPILPIFHHLTAGPAGAPWITFIPGIGNDASFWRHQAAALSARYQVLCFDPWGHGDSPPPPPGCRFDDIVQGVVQLWDALGIARSAVVGLGFGGSVALALAIDHPTRVERVAAFCCRPRQPDDRRDFWRARGEAARSGGMEALVSATVDRWLRPEVRAAHPEIDRELRAMMRRTSVEGYVAYVNVFAEMDFSARLGQLAVPTLLVAAEHDHGGGPVESMQAMAKQIPGARLEILAGVGHICTHEAPDAASTLLQDFMTGLQTA